jgi:hypothetical protein
VLGPDQITGPIRNPLIEFTGQKPFINITFPVRYIHDQRVWIQRLQRAGHVIAQQPPMAFLLL